jgi:hypothetical protein
LQHSSGKNFEQREENGLVSKELEEFQTGNESFRFEFLTQPVPFIRTFGLLVRGEETELYVRCGFMIVKI